MRVLASSIIYTSWAQSMRNLLAILRRENKKSDLVSSYEERFAHTEKIPFVRATSMARTALWHSLKALGARRGDSILLSPVNIPEMLAVIQSLGLRPTFVDFTPQSLFIDPDDLKRKAESSKAKFLFLTYIAGQIGDLQRVSSFCRESGITLIQDATQANLCLYKGRSLGQWADITIFSTCELKFVHTYRGGMIGVNTQEHLNLISRSLDRVTNHASSWSLLKKWFTNTIASTVLDPKWFGSLFHIFANQIFVQNPTRDFRLKNSSFGVGYFFGDDYHRINERLPDEMVYRPSNFEAGIGLEDLKLMPDRVRRHQEIARKYNTYLRDTFALPRQSPEAESSYWRFPIILPDDIKTDSFRKRMRKIGVIVEKTGLSFLPGEDELKARKIIDRTLFLPCHAGLNDREVESMATAARKALEDL